MPPPGACACCSSGTRRSSTPRTTTCDEPPCHRCGTPSVGPPAPGSRCRYAASASCSADELSELSDRAEAWRRGEPDRGFSMALGRSGDRADDEVLHVTAHGSDGSLVGLLSLVPWGRAGVSLDVMRRSPDAPHGVTELMVNELLTRSRQLGLTRVSLNFCMFRAVFEDAERLGSRSLTRVGASVLGLLDRVWQLERLYRSNKKYEPSWQPRFLCYDDAVSLPQVAVAVGAAEGFVRYPSLRSSSTELDPEHLALAAEMAATSVDVEALGPRRSDQFRQRAATVERMREAGLDAYPVGASSVATTRARRPRRAGLGPSGERSRWWGACARCVTTAASSSPPSSTATPGCRCCWTRRGSVASASTSSRRSSTSATSCVSTA